MTRPDDFDFDELQEAQERREARLDALAAWGIGLAVLVVVIAAIFGACS